MKRIVLALLPLLGIFVAPTVHADDKAKAAPKAAPAPPAKFSDADFARLQLAQAQMNDADKAYRLSQRDASDAQRTYREAQARLNAMLLHYDVRAEDLQSGVVKIGDDGTITRPTAPPAPVKPSKK